jgi:5-methylcytosine-specific restriction protein A
MCLARGRTTAATVVDHKIPHKGDQVLFWDQANWQSLCADDHDRHKQQLERLGYSLTIGANGWPTDPNHPSNR